MSKKLLLVEGPPWGFRIVGGADVNQNIVVSRVTPGSSAAKAGLRSRDILLAINGRMLKDSSREEAEAMIRTSTSGKLELILKLATAWDAKPERMKDTDPTWTMLAQELEKPRDIGKESEFGGLVTLGKQFKSAELPPTVAAPEHDVLEKRRFLPKTSETICNTCTLPITDGEYSSVEGLHFHKSCFICGAPNCQGSLDGGFMVNGGKPYCISCHNKFFTQPCLKCQKPMFGEVFRAFNCQWHVECFVCAECNKPICNAPFQMENGNVYCDEDHRRLFAVMCFACGKIIGPGDKEIKAIDEKWHDKCFNCQKCRRNLNGKRFIRRANRPFCPTCK